jgi:hypothetical protein
MTGNEEIGHIHMAIGSMMNRICESRAFSIVLTFRDFMLCMHKIRFILFISAEFGIATWMRIFAIVFRGFTLKAIHRLWTRF